MLLSNDYEIIYEKDNKEGLPCIIRNDVTFYLSNSAVTVDGSQYKRFFDAVDKIIENKKNIIIDFKIGYYNSKSILMLRDLFAKLNKNYFKCKPTINWYYYENDLNMQEAGIDYQEDYPNIIFNPIILKD